MVMRLMSGPKKSDIRILGCDEEQDELMAVLAFLCWQQVPHKVELNEAKLLKGTRGKKTVIMKDGHAPIAVGFLDIIEYFCSRGLIRDF